MVFHIYPWAGEPIPVWLTERMTPECTADLSGEEVFRLLEDRAVMLNRARDGTPILCIDTHQGSFHQR